MWVIYIIFRLIFEINDKKIKMFRALLCYFLTNNQFIDRLFDIIQNCTDFLHSYKFYVP